MAAKVNLKSVFAERPESVSGFTETQGFPPDPIWATQKAMSVLFDCTTDNIGLHLKNIFASGELKKESVTEKISATASDGKNYQTQFYNLDAIII